MDVTLKTPKRPFQKVIMKNIVVILLEGACVGPLLLYLFFPYKICSFFILLSV